MILALLLACGQPDAVALPATTDLAPLEAPRLLRRISIDLRGVLPSTEELDAVEADPDLIGPYRDAWLEDPRFETRLADLLADRWYTRIDEYHVFYPEYDVLADQPDIEYPFERSVGDEPLRLMSWIVAHDRPWSEVVTADYTVANELLESIWPIVRDSTEPGWQPAHYTDGRPAVGVLASNGLWWRYVTTVSNYNRARVAAIMRLLICEDIQSRPVTFAEQPALADGDNIEAALRENPYCLGCHSAIDPIAATLFGFWAANQHNATEISIYHPDREALGGEQMGVSPAWYGTPVYGLMELGPTIAADPRFDRCAVQSMAEIYWQRASLVEDEPTMEALGETYAAAGGELKPVIAALMETASYQAGALGDDPSQELEEAEVVTRPLGPSALDTIVADLSGFHWTWEASSSSRTTRSATASWPGGWTAPSSPAPRRPPASPGCW